MMQNLFEEYEHVQEHYQICAKEVAKVILNAAILEHPDQRYVVGKYSEMMVGRKMTMSDTEYYNMLKNQLFGSKLQ